MRSRTWSGASEEIRKRPDIEALIQRAQAVERWLEIASACDCATVDVCSLFTDPALAPPAAGG